MPSGPAAFHGLILRSVRSHAECLVVGDWSRIDVRPCYLHLEAAKEEVELLRLHCVAAGQAAGIALPGDVTYILLCPAGVRVVKVVIDPTPEEGLQGCLGSLLSTNQMPKFKSKCKMQKKSKTYQSGRAWTGAWTGA